MPAPGSRKLNYAHHAKWLVGELQVEPLSRMCLVADGPRDVMSSSLQRLANVTPVPRIGVGRVDCRRGRVMGMA